MLAPLDSPVMKDFVDNLEPINILAEKSPGFIWRLKDDSNSATAIRIFDDDYMIVNLSVWKNTDSLFDYVYKSKHLEVFKRKSEWFERMPERHMALWYVPEGHIPSVNESLERLLHLRTNGESLHAFTFRKKFSPEGL